MALTISSNIERSTSLEDYCDYINRRVDINDLDSVCASADELKALANNDTFLAEYLNKELLDWRHCQSKNSYTAQTLMLGGGRGFLIRANIWMPPAQDPAEREDQKKLFFYEIPHDHNFSFLTVGYFGPGYETTIYEYDGPNVKGVPGEPVELRFLEKTTLPTGKMMLYRRSCDIHSQGHPEAFSISLNLLLTPPGMHRQDQYLFDLASSRITAPVKNASSSRLMICRVAGYIGNAETASLLDSVARTHASPRVRLAAAESLTALDPSSEAHIWRRAVDDLDPVVQERARRHV